MLTLLPCSSSCLHLLCERPSAPEGPGQEVLGLPRVRYVLQDAQTQWENHRAGILSGSLMEERSHSPPPPPLIPPPPPPPPLLPLLCSVASCCLCHVSVCSRTSVTQALTSITHNPSNKFKCSIIILLLYLFSVACTGSPQTLTSFCRQ